jgi:VWFA-related protein
MGSFRLFIWVCVFTSLFAFALPPIGGVSNTKAPPPRPPGNMNTGVTSDHPNANQESKVEFRSDTVLVQVPVVVVDKQGNHVSGLTKEDVEVLENGKAQKIATFEEFNTPNQLLTPNSAVPNTFSNSLGPAGSPHNITVVVFDTVNTPFLDQAYGRKELIRYLATSLDPGQSFAIVVLTSAGIRVLQAPTQDAATLLQAVNRLKGELSEMEDTDIAARAAAVADTAGDFPVGAAIASPSQGAYAGLRNFVLNGDAGVARLQQDRAIEATMRGFLDISWALSGVSGRKSLIWATGSFPFYIDSPGAVPAHLAILYERTMKALNDAQIAVYPVDVRGLVNTSPGASTRGLQGSAPVRQFAARNWLQGSTIDTLRDFADMTGGRAFYNTNDIATSFHRATADSAAYYVVSYYLDTANRNPGWRKLQVKVNRKSVEIRSRNGFFVTNATVNPALSLKLDLEFAINSPFDCTGVPLSVQWTDPPLVDTKSVSSNLDSNQDGTGAGKIDKKKVGFLLRVPGNGVSIEPGTANHFNLDLLAYAFTGKQTETAASFAKNFEGSFPDTQLPKFREKGFGYRQSLDLPPGKYTVRFVVRDNLSGRVGSISAPVTVN